MSYYFQHDPKQLSVMTLMSHTLNHLPDDIYNTSPPPALWEFITERSMGRVTQSVTSCIFPFAQLANMLLQCKQLKVMWMKYLDMKQDLDYLRQCCNWHVISKVEKCFPEIHDQIILRTLCSWYKLMPTEKVVIGVYFQKLLGLTVSSNLIAKHLHDKVEQWGKIHFKGDTECVWSCWAQELMREMHWDVSFARVHPSNSLFNCELTYWYISLTLWLMNMRTIWGELPGTSRLYLMVRCNAMYMSHFQLNHTSRQRRIQQLFSHWWCSVRQMGRMQAWSWFGMRKWRQYGHSASWQSTVSLGKSRLAINGELLTEAMGHNAQWCMSCGNWNTSQKTIIIELFYILYFIIALAAVTCSI